MSRDRAAKRSLFWFCLAALPPASASAMGRPGAGGAMLLAGMIAIVGIYELTRGAE